MNDRIQLFGGRALDLIEKIVDSTWIGPFGDIEMDTDALEEAQDLVRDLHRAEEEATRAEQDRQAHAERMDDLLSDAEKLGNPAW